MKKRKNIILIVIISVIVFLVAGLFMISNKLKILLGLEKIIQIKTDITPIYNHFPSLPKTSTIEWTSITKEGIGLGTIELYVFAKYDNEDLYYLLENYTISKEQKKINSPFTPSFTQNEIWYEIENIPNSFQDGVKQSSRMSTRIYVNEKHTIIYIYAIGES